MFYINSGFDLPAFSVLPARDIFYVLQPGLASLTGTRDGKAVLHVSEVLSFRNSSTINTYSSIDIFLWDSNDVKPKT